MLTATAPAVGLDEAVALARRLYKLDVTGRLLASERDRNFHLRTSDGQAFVLKVANAAEDPAVTNLQTEALRHIMARDPGLPVPRLCPTLDGAFENVATGRDGARHIVRLLTFLAGQPLQLMPPSRERAAAIGRCLARLDIALSDFQHPAASHHLLWDLQRAPALRALLPHVEDDERRRLATCALDRYEQTIAPLLGLFRAQVIHNDANPHNILFSPERSGEVAGLLDFGDIVHTPLVNEIAIAAAYQVEGDDPLERPVALAAAYHVVRPLTSLEADSLFSLVTLRHAFSVTIAEWRASLHPDNAPYILRNQPRAAAALASLSRVGLEVGRTRFRRACGVE